MSTHPDSPATTTTTPSRLQNRSRRACSDPIGNDYAQTGGITDSVKGCAICHNQDSYGKGDSVCGRCNRCHGCGSTNNGIGPLQAIYFGGKKVVRKVVGGDGGEKEGGEEGREKK